MPNTSDNIIFDTIKTKTGFVGHIRLNRPSHLNALSHEMILQMSEKLQQWKSDSNIHAVLISSDDERAFCAGGDIRAIHALGKTDKESALAFFKDEYALNLLIGTYPKPYISLLEGLTLGGGIGVSLHGSHRIGTSKAKFGMPETGIGFFPDIGAAFLLNQCPGAIGMYLGLTGTFIDAADAYYACLIDYHLPPLSLKRIIEEFEYCDLRQHAFKEVGLMLESLHEPLAHPSLKNVRPIIDECFSHQNITEIFHALSQKVDPFSIKTYELLKTRCPLSCAVTASHLTSMKNKTLADCLEEDTRLVHSFLNHPDFYEGVRAAVIDKDKQPRWQHTRFEDITPVMINDFLNGK